MAGENLGSKSIWDTRPEFSKPSLPSFSTPVLNGIGACGSYWDFVEIRQPYKNIDKYVESLPKIISVGREDLDTDTATDRAKIIRHWVSIDGLTHDVISAAESMYEKYKRIIDQKNSKAIKAHIDLAWKYANNAKKLWDWWANKYVSIRTPLFEEIDITVSEDSEWLKKNYAAFLLHFGGWAKKNKDKKVPLANANYKIHWPLSEAKYAGCDQDYPYPNLGVAEYGANFKDVFVNCPESYEFDAHYHDAQLYCDLVIASVAHARCATEASAAVGILYKNKATVSGKILPTQGPGLTDSASGWVLATKKPSISDTGSGIYAPPSEPDSDAPIIEPPVTEDGAPESGIEEDDTIPDIGIEGDGIVEPDTAPETKKVSKKKDNTMLIAGVAAVGLLLMMKK